MNLQRAWERQLLEVIWDALDWRAIAAVVCLGRWGYQPDRRARKALVRARLVNGFDPRLYLTGLGLEFFRFARRRVDTP